MREVCRSSSRTSRVLRLLSDKRDRALALVQLSTFPKPLPEVGAFLNAKLGFGGNATWLVNLPVVQESVRSVVSGLCLSARLLNTVC